YGKGSTRKIRFPLSRHCSSLPRDRDPGPAMTDTTELQKTIEAAFEDRANIGVSTGDPVRGAVNRALDLLDRGEARVAEKGKDGWVVHQWLKKAVLLSFRLNPMAAIGGGPDGASWWDKVASKFEGWGALEFEAAGFRA